MLRFKIWRSRRRARLLSRYTTDRIESHMNGIRIGLYRNGREVKP